MPKAPSSLSSSSSNKHRSELPLSQTVILKRNQACHQCRKRKLKCDARRPCTTCARSHAYAKTHSSDPSELPPEPHCTYDEVPESEGAAGQQSNRLEKLEDRIHELEAMLEQSRNSDTARSPNSDAQSSSRISDTLAVDSRRVGSSPILDPLRSGYITEVLSDRSGNSSLENSIVSSGFSMSLPSPELLHHLVDVFFLFHPHSRRLLHQVTFMTCLQLPASHPKFPCAPLLHAICAVGSLFTAAVTSPPYPDFARLSSDEMYYERSRNGQDRPDSFAEHQAKLAKAGVEELTVRGEHVFQILQARIVLNWFYGAHGRFVEQFMNSGQCMRLTVPYGLNTCPPFHAISPAIRPASILSPARTIVEDEMRRNAFWLAYATERQHHCTGGWAYSLDDNDISQLLPVTGSEFNSGTLVSHEERQFAHSKNILLEHPLFHVDSFMLFIKGTMLISRVHNFNCRFRAKYYSGTETAVVVDDRSADPLTGVDPRQARSFVELDNISSTFLSSFPAHLRTPIDGSVVDVHLYTAVLTSHLAIILLHESLANIRERGCVSSLKIMAAAKAILQQVHMILATSFDFTLLDWFCAFCWFCSARVLSRFLQAAIEQNMSEQITILSAEISTLRTALQQFGRRCPIALYYVEWLGSSAVTQSGTGPMIRLAGATMLQNLPAY